ncbi:hypothetical protein AZ026_001152, partial [Klebsiella pneumoniae]
MCIRDRSRVSPATARCPEECPAPTRPLPGAALPRILV